MAPINTSMGVETTHEQSEISEEICARHIRTQQLLRTG